MTVVPLPGAVPGDTVVIGFSEPLLAGVILTRTLTEPGAIGVTLLNFSGRSVSPPQAESCALTRGVTSSG